MQPTQQVGRGLTLRLSWGKGAESSVVGKGEVVVAEDSVVGKGETVVSEGSVAGMGERVETPL